MILSDFRKDTRRTAGAESCFYRRRCISGDNQLEALTTLKSKNDLIGEVIGLLQSPAKNVISGLNAGAKLASLVKALEERAHKLWKMNAKS